MKVQVLASAPGHRSRVQYLSTFLVNDTVAIDAGCLGLYREPGDQSRVSHVFLTHTHADHLVSLPIFLENSNGGEETEASVYGSPAVLESLHTDIFNDRIWPTFERLTAGNRSNFRLHTLEEENPIEVNGLRITPVAVNHTVPTFGFVVEDDESAVVFGSDTGPTDRIWEVAKTRKTLKAVFVESSFPNHMEEKAKRFGHLTPNLLAREVEKLPEGLLVVAIHIKAAYFLDVVAELFELEIPHLEIGEGGKEWEF
jgi:ribonuclease BN (tRNA processing enzyme)